VLDPGAAAESRRDEFTVTLSLVDRTTEQLAAVASTGERYP
jgi:hypothetical protein